MVFFKKNYSKAIVCILLLFTFLSCKDDKDEIRIKRQQEESLKIESLNIIANIYQSSYLWDTLSYHLSINYDNVINSRSQLIDEFDIKDILLKKSDTTYHISLSVQAPYYNFYHPKLIFYFDLLSSKENINKLLFWFNNEDYDEDFNFYLAEKDLDLVLIVKTSEISKIKFVVENERDEEDERYVSDILIKDALRFKIKGELIDIVKLK